VTVAPIAEDEQDFVRLITAALKQSAFHVSDIEDVEPWAMRITNDAPAQEIVDLVDLLTSTDPIAIGDFYSYDSE
jgi:hypothetical protein